MKERFAGVNADLYWAASKATCSIRNQYFTADKEKRACTSMGVCDPFRFEELPQVKTKVYHFAGLVYGDFDGALLAEAAKHGKVGLDVQCMLRHVEPDKSMAFHDWAEKKELLPLMDYFKTDAAEAEVLTGLTDRVEAAKMLHDWGAKEVVITHNTEVLAYDGNKVYTCPIKARNLSGRTGRGDTTFAGYIAERQRDAVAAGNEDRADGLIDGRAVHVDRRAKRQDEGADLRLRTHLVAALDVNGQRRIGGRGGERGSWPGRCP